MADQDPDNRSGARTKESDECPPNDELSRRESTAADAPNLASERLRVSMEGAERIAEAARRVQESLGPVHRFQEIVDRTKIPDMSAFERLQKDHERLNSVLDRSPLMDDRPSDLPAIQRDPAHQTNEHLQTIAEVLQHQTQHLAQLERRAEEARMSARSDNLRLWLLVALSATGVLVAIAGL